MSQIWYMKMAARIEGMPFIASTKIRTGRPSLPLTSLRKTAVPTPSGTEMRRASPTCSKLPTMAARPPPAVAGLSGPTWRWSTVKKWRRSVLYPRNMTYPMITARAAKMTAANPPIITVTRRSLAAILSWRCRWTIQYMIRNVANQQRKKPRPPLRPVSCS